ncbi:hypothetical protein B0X71_07130 [Planococcus lenghuensis]|uniref:GGDEF domain-containing protein n=2 Tax=Planococcus lenghuensis TaxID=2213202 RepID=A0A1Q2L3N0_9BACL|nr:hypothetical protein B0X71_07130 [Planococcus lenghuensis]
MVYRLSPPAEMDLSYLLVFAAFAVFMMLFPLTINGNSIFIVQWATLAIFLKYGLFMEMIVIQLSAVFVILRARSSEPVYLRLPFNSLMFFAVSIIAGTVFFVYGGEIGSEALGHVFFYGLLFQLIYFLANHFILYFYSLIIDEETKFITIDTIWDFCIMLTIFPFTLILYLVEAHVGVYGVFLLGLPFIIVSYFLRMYSDSERINRDLKIAVTIGHQLAGSMTSNEVLDLFVVRIAELLPVDYVYLIDHRRKQGDFAMLRRWQDSRFLDEEFPICQRSEGVAGHVLARKKPVIYHSREEWEWLTLGHIAADAESLMALPISRNGITEGILVVAARKKNVFVHHQLKILEMLCSYFAVSLERAGLVQSAIARSERCGLTKLYNYRYIEDRLESLVQQVNKGEMDALSLIMMDIDFFKSINDRYGHQSGNDVLIRVARLIEEEVGEAGIIARYGGEEFIVALPDYSKTLALLLGEKLRKRIEDHDFEIQSDLDEGRTLQKVKITMSIGIASAPEDSDDAMGLIRNADRALYIGAKQAGRNKVAAYAKM